MSLILSGTEGVGDVDGSAATPAIRGTDTNTGIFFPAADTIAFAEGGVESARFDSAGNMGLGVTPSAWGSNTKAFQFAKGASTGALSSVLTSDEILLTRNAYYDNTNFRYVSGGSSFATSYQQSSDGKHIWSIAPSGTAGNAISFTQAMTLDSSGRLGIGTTSGSAALAASANGGTDVAVISGIAGAAYFGVVGAKPIIFESNGAERARIDSSGAIAGTSAGNYGIRQAITAGAGTTFGIFVGAHSGTSGNTSSGTDSFIVWSNGNVVNTNNSYGAISDAKLKENVIDATPKLEKLQQVRIVNYNMVGDEQKQIGVIAQELEQIFPGMVDESPDYEEVTTTDEDGNETAERVATGTTTKSVKYSVFVPMLIKAIQEQQAMIASQSELITAQQAALETLTARVAALEGAQP